MLKLPSGESNSFGCGTCNILSSAKYFKRILEIIKLCSNPTCRKVFNDERLKRHRSNHFRPEDSGIAHSIRSGPPAMARAMIIR